MHECIFQYSPTCFYAGHFFLWACARFEFGRIVLFARYPSIISWYNHVNRKLPMHRHMNFLQINVAKILPKRILTKIGQSICQFQYKTSCTVLVIHAQYKYKLLINDTPSRCFVSTTTVDTAAAACCCFYRDFNLILHVPSSSFSASRFVFYALGPWFALNHIIINERPVLSLLLVREHTKHIISCNSMPDELMVYVVATLRKQN